MSVADGWVLECDDDRVYCVDGAVAKVQLRALLASTGRPWRARPVGHRNCEKCGYQALHVNGVCKWCESIRRGSL